MINDSNPSVPFLFFRYAGRESRKFLGRWKRRTTTEKTRGGTVTHVTRTDSVTGLKITVHIRRFDNFPGVDWVGEIENSGTTDTPLIEDIWPLDLTVPIPTAEILRLHHANGSAARMDDFLPLTTELRPNRSITLAPVGGRSSNHVLPFMNLQRADGGLVLAIGWTGQWTAKFARTTDAVRLTAGMERTRLRLHPGEKIRTPRILALPWQGDDAESGPNLLRRVLLAHYLPRLNGQLVLPPTAQHLFHDYYLTGKASEKSELTALPKVAQLGAEAYWIDASWYGGPGNWSTEAGSWVVNRQKFPRGLKPISDAAHRAGLKFLLWFEPERACPESLLHRAHPEFFLRSEKNPSNLLLNLGQPAARQHITDLISNLITANGVDIYRQDFNFIDPLLYWQAADAPDRIGMTEIRHVEGLYAFWDELRRRHPQLWIDNCASGGRRIDLETLTRSLPLLPSDFQDEAGLPYGLGLRIGEQCISAGLARWVPLFGGAVLNFTPYGTRGQILGGGFAFGRHIAERDFPPVDSPVAVHHKAVLARGKTIFETGFPLGAARAAIQECQNLRPFLLGDFHLLLPVTVSDRDWCAWQLHRADLNAGVAMFLRRHRCPFPTMAAQLKGINPNARYAVSLSADYQTAQLQLMRGRDLARLCVTISTTPGTLLLRYNQIEKRNH